MSEDFLKSAGLPDEIWETIAKESQSVVVKTERRRWGKYVTVVEGFDKDVDGKKVAKELKQKLACGGTFKKGRVELQGDHKSKITPVLVEMGFPKESIEVR